jgi:hypothetical protein
VDKSLHGRTCHAECRATQPSDTPLSDAYSDEECTCHAECREYTACSGINLERCIEQCWVHLRV